MAARKALVSSRLSRIVFLVDERTVSCIGSGISDRSFRIFSPAFFTAAILSGATIVASMFPEATAKTRSCGGPATRKVVRLGVTPRAPRARRITIVTVRERCHGHFLSYEIRRYGY